MMGWMVYGEIEASVGLLPRRAARIISKRRRDATGENKLEKISGLVHLASKALHLLHSVRNAEHRQGKEFM